MCACPPVFLYRCKRFYVLKGVHFVLHVGKEQLDREHHPPYIQSVE